MKNRLNKLIDKGIINENELDGFIQTLLKLSSLRVIPSKPKKVMKKLGIKEYLKQKRKETQEENTHTEVQNH